MASTLARMQEVFSSWFDLFVAFHWSFLLRSVKILGTTSRLLLNMTGSLCQLKRHLHQYLLNFPSDFDQLISNSNLKSWIREWHQSSAVILGTALRQRWGTRQQSFWRTPQRGSSSWPKSTPGSNTFPTVWGHCPKKQRWFHNPDLIWFHNNPD